jgi:hypothetical protein
MPCSISENITQFSTNTRRKKFCLFIYSTGVGKKNGSLQQQKNQQKQKIKKQHKTKRKIADHFLFVVSHMVYLAIPKFSLCGTFIL